MVTICKAAFSNTRPAFGPANGDPVSLAAPNCPLQPQIAPCIPTILAASHRPRHTPVMRVHAPSFTHQR